MIISFQFHLFTSQAAKKMHVKNYYSVVFLCDHFGVEGTECDGGHHGYMLEAQVHIHTNPPPCTPICYPVY